MSRVHFANMNQDLSPVSEMSSDFGGERMEGVMLKIVPNHAVVFSKVDNETIGTMEIFNIGDKPLTYKVKTTSPEKFRVRPSNGIITPGTSNKVNIVLQQGHQLGSILRDKFLVMSMPFVDMDPSTDIPELWRNTPINSPNVEQYRLRCSVPANSNDDNQKNGGGTYSQLSSDADRSLAPSIAQLTDTTMRLERQIKFNQTLQWITIIVYLFLAIAIVYILKIEIRNSSIDSITQQILENRNDANSDL